MTKNQEAQIHGTVVELEGAGILLTGPSGSGKSDLALRLMDIGARLVADDRVNLGLDGDRLMASPPAALAGLLEVRGLGILAFSHDKKRALDLVLDLDGATPVDRLPEPCEATILGIALPRFHVNPFEASAVQKVRLAVGLASGSIMPVTEANSMTVDPNI